MWRLLPFLLLTACALDEHDPTLTQETGQDGYRVVAVLDLPLTLSSDPDPDKPVTKEFGRRDTRGWIRVTGAWNISTAVTHTRLRCATYETGIQIGEGDPGCSEVRWLGEVQFGTRQTHCNSATLIHSGGGTLAGTNGVFETASCVRVVTRCDGAC